MAKKESDPSVGVQLLAKTDSLTKEELLSGEVGTKIAAAKRARKKRARGKTEKSSESEASGTGLKAKFPRHSVEKALRIPRAILDQNAGKECSEKDAAGFIGLGSPRGPFALEISSAIKFGLLERPAAKRIKLTELAKKILRPQNDEEALQGLRQAVLRAPDISEVYNHYRGENLPDTQFFDNALADTFGIPQAKLAEFKEIFFETLKMAKLVEEREGKYRVLDVSKDAESGGAPSETLKKLEKSVTVTAGDSCFVVMPFALPHGSYYAQVYEPAIKKAGLKPVRADSEIFGAGKIIDQIWTGINAAKVLLAELTTKNPNVFYELGLAHALKKPVVLVSSNEKDVPFDLQHIRVIYYDVNDPYWGNKLLDKVAENILSAIKNPEEAIFSGTAPIND